MTDQRGNGFRRIPGLMAWVARVYAGGVDVAEPGAPGDTADDPADPVPVGRSTVDSSSCSRPPASGQQVDEGGAGM
jgi:hypothetical protein